MRFLERAWYGKAAWLALLWPVSLLFTRLARWRRHREQPAAKPGPRPAPLIVVGNLSVGGTGKTPILTGLARHLLNGGFKPGIISRGYGGRSSSYPLAVDANTAAAEAGDEAVLIAEQTDCPVVVDPDRCAALEYLLNNTDVDVVLSDDGLQHYRLRRDIEICVVDGQRLFGNGWCLPAGPLREPVSRLQEVDYVVVNGATEESHPLLQEAIPAQLSPKFFVNLVSGEKRPFSGAPFNIGNRVQAVSAIGNPGRFHEFLEKLPYSLEKISFPDHHPFQEQDFDAPGIDSHQPVVMTEKDAVKCRGFARSNFWYLSTEVDLPAAFLDEFSDRVGALQKKRTRRGRSRKSTRGRAEPASGSD